MSAEEYKRAWGMQGATNRESFRAELEKLAGKLDRSYRRERTILAVCAINTFAATALVIYFLFSRTPEDWSGIWPAFILQATGIFALAMLIRRHVQRRHAREWSGAPLREAARSALVDIAGEVQRLKILMVTGCIMIPFLALAVAQLYLAGKMNTRAVICFGILCATVFGVNAVVMTLRYRRTLRPRRSRFEQVLASLEQEAGLS
jgi:hypothetical protein